MRSTYRHGSHAMLEAPEAGRGRRAGRRRIKHRVRAAPQDWGTPSTMFAASSIVCEPLRRIGLVRRGDSPARFSTQVWDEALRQWGAGAARTYIPRAVAT